MNDGKCTYIWERHDWPHWIYDARKLAPLVAQTHQARGYLLGRMHDLGMDQKDRTATEALSLDIVKTSEIEGEILDLEGVRSSVAHRLGVDLGGLSPTYTKADGVVDMILDAIEHPHIPLTNERLCDWHTALFTGVSGVLSPICIGGFRDDAMGPMQVVSGPLHRRKVHFEAPPAGLLDAEVTDFLMWLNLDQQDDILIKSGLAHLWFVTIHPFDDGNGRIARAIGDRVLAMVDGVSKRYYSVSQQIERERKDYYLHLEKAQKGSMDVTDWLEWFLGCVLRALENSQALVSGVLNRSACWKRWATIPMNDRQIKLLNKLLDGFEGKLTTAKWAAIAKCSTDSALRDINDLVENGVLIRGKSGGRSTAYQLAEP